jgi:hypothetical protein
MDCCRAPRAISLFTAKGFAVQLLLATTLGAMLITLIIIAVVDFIVVAAIIIGVIPAPIF